MTTLLERLKELHDGPMSGLGSSESNLADLLVDHATEIIRLMEAARFLKDLTWYVDGSNTVEQGQAFDKAWVDFESTLAPFLSEEDAQ